VWPKQVLGGSTVFGFPVGILTINTAHPLLPGNVQHAQSFDAPVIYEQIAVPDLHALMRGEPTLLDPIINAAQRLSVRGVRAVAGACGSFGYYQKAVADAMEIPVFLSIMTQVPLLQQSLGPRKKLCILCAAESAINAQLFEQCSITNTSNLVIREMKGHSEFDRILEGCNSIDPGKLGDEVVEVCGSAFREEPKIAAFLIQCSDLPPFGSQIQRATGLPVFDMTLLIRWLQSAADYPIYAGMNRIMS
jgi:hypothetical protein